MEKTKFSLNFSVDGINNLVCNVKFNKDFFFCLHKMTKEKK